MDHAAIVLALAVPLAGAIDACFGEPRNALHPVAWLGRAMQPCGQMLLGRPPGRAFVGGAVVWLVFAAALVALAVAVQGALLRAPAWMAVPLLAVALKPTFAGRMLIDEVASVERALGQGVGAARERLARLVSRDVSAFDAAALRETALETLAENLNDSLVAPLFWFALGGLPAAALYRWANTADAMWGYHGRYEWAGKWAARADDLLSWVPARLTAALLCLATWQRPSWRALRIEARRTPSPNGGWPMGAMALLLGVQLCKPGVYVLNAAGCPPQAHHTQRALDWAGRAVLWSTGLCLLVLALIAATSKGGPA